MNRSRIKYLIVGGIAVNLYGFQRLTADIDILLSLDEKNLHKMDFLMKKMGYIERLPITIKDLGNAQQVKNWLKEKGMTAFTFVSNTGPELDLDILVENSLKFKTFYHDRTVMTVWGMRVPVIAKSDLIDMKKKANRDKDLIDLKHLLELKG